MKISFVFFGNSPFSKIVLKELTAAGLVPTLIIDDARQPVTTEILRKQAPTGGWDMFVVASFGRIIPAEVIDLPKRGSLNVHPSLLPKYRGPSPIQSAILADDGITGVTIMKMDEQVDHGPIIIQETIVFKNWPPSYDELEMILGRAGGKLLAEILPKWCAEDIETKPQDHRAATFTKKVAKTDGELRFAAATKNFLGDPYQNFLKIQAFSRWPKAYFFIERKNRQQRVNITNAHLEQIGDAKTLIIDRVIPEGKHEMTWRDFAKGYLA